MNVVTILLAIEGALISFLTTILITIVWRFVKKVDRLSDQLSEVVSQQNTQLKICSLTHEVIDNKIIELKEYARNNYEEINKIKIKLNAE